MTSEATTQSAAKRFLLPPEFPPSLKLARWVGRQTWLPRGQERVVSMLWRPNRGKHFPFEVDFFGRRYRGDLIEYIDWMVFMYGSYSYPELSLLQELASIVRRGQKEVNFFDIGANAGNHTLFMSGIADRIISFEPFPGVRARIEDKIALNKLTNVQIVPMGLGEEDTDLDYYSSSDNNAGRGTFMPEHGSGFNPPISLPIRNGDRLFDQLGLPRMDVVKIDVEGFEAHVVRGLSAHIRRDRPAIMMEWGPLSRQIIPTEAEFRSLFYDDAVFAIVDGRQGCRFELKPFDFASALEILVLPPERADLIRNM